MIKKWAVAVIFITFYFIGQTFARDLFDVDKNLTLTARINYTWTNYDNGSYICSSNNYNITNDQVVQENIACAQIMSGGISNEKSQLNKVMCDGDGVIQCILFSTISVNDAVNGDCLENGNFTTIDSIDDKTWIYSGSTNDTILTQAIGKKEFLWTISHTTTLGIRNGFSQDVQGRTVMKVLALCNSTATVSSYNLKFVFVFALYLIFYFA